MKKLFMFLAVAGLATFGVSCSSDDNSSNEDKMTHQLILNADRVDIKVGDKVNFYVQADRKNVDGAKIFINGEEASNEYVFNESGTFEVYASKVNFKDSSILKINVVADDEGPKPSKSFTLSVDKSEVKLGDVVTFTAKDNKEDIFGFTVQMVGGTKINGTTWTANKDGVVKFVATKEGYKTSNEVSVNVLKQDTPMPTENFISLGNKSIDLKGSAFFYFSKGGSVYSEVIDGKTFVPFIIRTFTVKIDDSISGTEYENSGSLLFYVEQEENSKALRLPWQVTTNEQIVIVDFRGKVFGVEFQADEKTMYSIPVFTTPNKDNGKGNVKLAVKGTDKVSGNSLASDFDGEYQAYYKIDLDNSNAKSIKNEFKIIVVR
ncbi:protein BatD [Myroides sp. LoEW2-1]|uniref:protein BatD n=1 Tax=Myroides sp. LoEW2-1 TaxID=2683192 RepID=UPI00132252E7|nr:protein BatD [Myroides sp. LoEW2-1]MVX36239.1 hypothetical protein [Myroides sp. LoEW2-1]